MKIYKTNNYTTYLFYNGLKVIILIIKITFNTLNYVYKSNLHN